MKKNVFYYFIVSLLMIACSNDNEEIVVDNTVTQLSLVDKNATAETKALYANLWKIQQTGFMFGHHDDLFYGRFWEYEENRSDTKDVCGDYPGVFSIDVAPIIDDRSDSNPNENAIRKRCILQANELGMAVVVCFHLNNPKTGGDSWDNSSNEVVKEILTNNHATQQKFMSWLDRFAQFAGELKDQNGNLIPLIFRPYHEHTQEWSWWGSSCATEQEYISLWQETVKYLRDVKGVHQLIYAISPQADIEKQESELLYRWPGDEYVDFIGIDSYHGLKPEIFSKNLRTLGNLSMKKMKPCGVTETGVEGFTDTDYWTEQILIPSEGRKVSMIVMWRNKFVGGNQTDMHYYSVFKGHSSERNFIRFYDSPYTFFCQDLPDMYTMPENLEVK